jgi:hypothetical protein
LKSLSACAEIMNQCRKPSSAGAEIMNQCQKPSSAGAEIVNQCWKPSSAGAESRIVQDYSAMDDNPQPLTLIAGLTRQIERFDDAKRVNLPSRRPSFSFMRDGGSLSAMRGKRHRDSLFLKSLNLEISKSLNL